MYTQSKNNSPQTFPEDIAYCVIFAESLGANDALTDAMKQRLEMARHIYEKHSAIQILITGDGTHPAGNTPELMRQYLLHFMEFPEDKIIIEKESLSTLDSLQNIKKIVDRKSFVFLTNDIHMKRCTYICRKLDLPGYGIVIPNAVSSTNKVYRCQEFLARLEDRFRLTAGMRPLYSALKNLRFLLSLYVGKRLFAKLKKYEEDPMTQPGRTATRICPDILKYLTRHIKIILVTGTNGKTSTVRMLEQQLKAHGISCFSNRSGANTYMGITAEFLIHSNAKGKYKEEYAIIECDEGNLLRVTPFLESNQITFLVTNLFQDQLDRFGQLEFTRNCILSGILDLPHAKVILNADCAMTASLATECPNQCIFFGLNGEEEKTGTLVKNTSLCPICYRPLHYNSRLYDHFGDYICVECGYKRPDRDALLAIHGDTCCLHLAGKQHIISLKEPVPQYCLYNNLGVAATLWQHGLDTLIKSCFLTDYYNPGRFEKITIDECDFYVILVKNAAGFQQSIKRLPQKLYNADLVFGLNDYYNDGIDVSWIWECDFSPILEQLEDDTNIYSFGGRCANMSLKLKYDGFDWQKIIQKEDFSQLYETLKQSRRSVYIFANYTMMFSTRVFLQKKANLKKFWEEES